MKVGIEEWRAPARSFRPHLMGSARDTQSCREDAFHLEPLHHGEEGASVKDFFGSPLGSPFSGNSHVLISPFCFSDEQEVGIL